MEYKIVGLYFLPEQVVPFPWNPMLQVHKNEPGVSLHVAFQSHTLEFPAHPRVSIENNGIILLPLDYQNLPVSHIIRGQCVLTWFRLSKIILYNLAKRLVPFPVNPLLQVQM